MDIQLEQTTQYHHQNQNNHHRHHFCSKSTKVAKGKLEKVKNISEKGWLIMNILSLVDERKKLEPILEHSV